MPNSALIIEAITMHYISIWSVDLFQYFIDFGKSMDNLLLSLVTLSQDEKSVHRAIETWSFQEDLGIVKMSCLSRSIWLAISIKLRFSWKNKFRYIPIKGKCKYHLFFHKNRKIFTYFYFLANQHISNLYMVLWLNII